MARTARYERSVDSAENGEDERPAINEDEQLRKPIPEYAQDPALRLSFDQEQKVLDQLVLSEKKRIKNVAANSFVYQRRKIEAQLDDGYRLDIPEEDRWHESHKGQDYLINKLNTVCIGTLNKSFKDLRKPLPGKEALAVIHETPKKAGPLKLEDGLADLVPEPVFAKGVTAFLTQPLPEDDEESKMCESTQSLAALDTPEHGQSAHRDSEQAKIELRNTGMPKFKIKEGSSKNVNKVGRAIFARSKMSNEDIDIWDQPESTSVPLVTRNSMSTSPARST